MRLRIDSSPVRPPVGVNCSAVEPESHAMSRTTLKLPPKPAASSAFDDASRTSRKKPIRGGSQSPKQSVAQRASSIAAKAARPAFEPRTPRPAPRGNPDVRRPSAPVAATVERNKEETPRPREVRAAELPKAYPKRGVARSTGARALPPPRVFTEERLVRPEIRVDDTPAPSPLIAPRQDAPPLPQRAKPDVPRRPLNEPPRLSKRVAEMTQCSRREADEWIENGWVRVDGVVVTTLGTRVHPNAKVEIKEEASKHETESVTILLNKPLDEAFEPAEGSSEAAMQLIRPENRWLEDDSRLTFKATHLRGLAQAGKLDSESTGMLVFTQEGSVARRITGDDTRLEKEYMVRVEGELSPEGMKLLNHGLSLDEVKLKRAQVSWQNEQQLRFVLHESKKQQIQRMCELVGLRVTSIKRIRIGSVSLGKLPAGKWRYLRENERF